MSWRLRRRLAKAERDGTALGNVLVDLGYVTRQQMHAAVAEHAAVAQHAKSLALLGNSMVALGLIDQDQLDHALLRQQVLRGQTSPSSLQRYGSERRQRLLNDVKQTLTRIATRTRAFVQKHHY